MIPTAREDFDDLTDAVLMLVHSQASTFRIDRTDFVVVLIRYIHATGTRFGKMIAFPIAIHIKIAAPTIDCGR